MTYLLRDKCRDYRAARKCVSSLQNSADRAEVVWWLISGVPARIDLWFQLYSIDDINTPICRLLCTLVFILPRLLASRERVVVDFLALMHVTRSAAMHRYQSIQILESLCYVSCGPLRLQ